MLTAAIIAAVMATVGAVESAKDKRETERREAERRKSAKKATPNAKVLKAEEKRRAARKTIEIEAENLDDLYLLMDTAQERYHNAAGSRETEKALRQVMALRRQIAATEARIEKAKYIVKYGG